MEDSPSKVMTASNLVTYKERSFKTRIDPELPIDSVIEQLSSAFKSIEPFQTLALRDESDILITNQNLHSKVLSQNRLKLVSSPQIEALDTIAALQYALQPSSPLPLSPSGRISVPLKLVLFNLHKFIHEEAFNTEFIKRGGLGLLVKLLMVNEEGDDESKKQSTDIGHGDVKPRELMVLSGNALAYALQGLAGLMDMEIGWAGLDDQFIEKIIQITTFARNNNVFRPACDILRRLIQVDPVTNTNTSSRIPSRKGKEKAIDQNMSISMAEHSQTPVYGFDRVYKLIKKDAVCLNAVARKVESDDWETAISSLALVNTMIKTARKQVYFGDLVSDLHACRVRKGIIRLLPLHEQTDLTPHLLEYQHNYLTILLWRYSLTVDLEDSSHQALIKEVNHRAGFEGEGEGDGEGDCRWSKGRTVLGLECLVKYAQSEDEFPAIIEDQSILGDRACHLDEVSEACVEILLRYYKHAEDTGLLGSVLHPFLIDFGRSHRLVMGTYLRIWEESQAVRPEDITHINNLVYSHIRHCLNHQDRSSWHTFGERLSESYEIIRDRYIQESNEEDELLRSDDVAMLREDVFEDTLGFVRQQRVDCMLQGSWFHVGVIAPTVELRGKRQDPSKAWRYIALSEDMKVLKFADYPSSTSPPSTPSHRDLTSSILLSSITSVQPSTSRPLHLPSQVIPSQTSFSLLSGKGNSVLDLVAQDNATYAEWIDGLRGLFAGVEGQGEVEMTKLMSRYVDSLTELQVRIKLLDMQGEKLHVPEERDPGPGKDLPRTGKRYWKDY